MSKHTNRLANETSPYLLQHAHNPVDWYPWGPEALARAKAEDRPILLSIGYSACHWCHVMAHESFEDEAIGRLMNEHFVCVKVDREERPDLDEIYMTATVMMNQGQGGWPMTVFLTPDQKPFFAGTYFPPADKYGRPGFGSLLKHFGQLWKTDRARLSEQAGELTAMLAQQATVAPGTGVGEAELERFVEQCRREFDATHGGFGGAPKFPPSQALALLLRHHHRTGDAQALEMVAKTLHGMADGGMYDHVGGGFARYSTDERWLVPHFEKMLYDNALLAKVYLEGFQATGEAKFGRTAREVLEYVLREMTDPAGGFYSATDADSEGVEGKFFVWTPAEVEAVLGDEEARRFNTFYGVTKHGNFEEKSIPHVTRSIEHVARELGIAPTELAASLEDARAKMYEARKQRVPPGLDDKVLTAWNGLMISAMAEGSRVLGEARYLIAAERAAEFLLRELAQADGRLFRTWRAGKAHLNAYLEDYAYLAAALLDLYEAGGPARWLTEACRMADRLLSDFRDAAGAFFNTAHAHEELIVRTRTGTDNATPAGNAVAALALARLSYHTGREDYRLAAEQAIEAYGRSIRQIPRAFATTLIAVDLLLAGPVELALAGAPGAADRTALERAVAQVYVPHHVIAHHDPAAGAGAGPLLEGRGAIDGRAALYVCREGTCLAPVTDPAQVAQVLADPAARTRKHRALGRAIAGAATPDGTRAMAERWSGERPDGYAALGTTDLTVSRLGFGCYRVDDETPEHHAALTHALEDGVNLIDTSTNYSDGGSERLIGVVLKELLARGKLRRDEVVLVSKIGYVQGQNLELAEKREQAGAPFPDMVKYMEGCWHCIAPGWLEDQLGRSLDRLQVETLDVCLLHNPEYYLSDAKNRGEADLEKVRDAFYRRLEDAFRFFEAQVAAGKIRHYGVSSNSLGNPSDDPEATSVTRILDAARAAGGDGHHCRVVQLPANLLESGVALERNTGSGQTALEAARAAGCGVLVNRPLNAFRGQGLLRLADHHVPDAGQPLDQLLHAVAVLEQEFKARIAPALTKLPAQMKPDRIARVFSLGEELDGIWTRLSGLDHWDQIETGMIMPQLSQVVRLLDRVLNGPMAGEWMMWRERYLPALAALMAEVRREATRISQTASAQVAARLDPALPATRAADPLSRKALWVLTSLPGVSCVLVGMRDPHYVDDAVTVLTWPPLPDPLKALEAMAAF